MDSNHRHRAYETPALPTELRRHGRSYDTSPKGGLTADQRIIKKRTDGVKPRLASREDAASTRPAHPSAGSARWGRIRVLQATLRLVSFAFDILRLIILRLVVPEALHQPNQSCRGHCDHAQRH